MMKKMNLKNQMESDLKKYYKKIKTCKNCKTVYGIDKDEKEFIDICPICANQVNRAYLAVLNRPEACSKFLKNSQ